METPLSARLSNRQVASAIVPSAEVQPQNYADLLRQGLHLAYFIIRDRAAAVQIVTGALNKLKVHQHRERKRVYWRYTSLKNKIYRIIRSERDMFQWLIFHESTSHETQRERAGLATEHDLVVSYVKHLLQTSSAKSAFYVNVAIQRLLYNYATAEAQVAYEWLTQHHPGAEMYRKVKKILMSDVDRRFGDHIKSCVGHRGERRFEMLANQKHWVSFVERCLRAFTPWSTVQACPVLGSLGLTGDQSLSAFGSNQDTLELRRCHVFIDPDCYRRLTEKAQLDAPRERLAVPRFFSANTDDQRGDRDRFPDQVEDWTDAEISQIMARTKEEETLREKVSPRFVSVLANGEECATIDVTGRTGRYECRLDGEVNLLEIATEFEGRPLLLATHWIEYTVCDGVAPTRATLNLGHGNKLSIEIERAEETEQRPRGIFLRLQCRRIWSLVTPQDLLKVLDPRSYSPVKLIAAASFLIAAGWLAGSLTSRQRLQKLNAELAATRAALDHRDSVRSTPEVRYRLAPDDFVQRGPNGAASEVSITIASHQEIVTLELPAGQQNLRYRAVLKTYFEDTEILSESSLTTQIKDRQEVVQFAVPASAFQDAQLYSVELYSMSNPKKATRIRSFRFYAIKK